MAAVVTTQLIVNPVSVTIGVAAKMTGVSVATLRRDVASGRVRRVPHVRTIIIPVAELDRVYGLPALIGDERVAS